MSVPSANGNLRERATQAAIEFGVREFVIQSSITEYGVGQEY